MKVSIGKYKKNGKSRNVKIEVIKDDVYSLDATLRLIIHPLLVKFKEQLMGYPIQISAEDHPEEITDNAEKWDFIIDEMIYAFGYDTYDLDELYYENKEEHIKAWKRISNGQRLFGKYFNDLWN